MPTHTRLISKWGIHQVAVTCSAGEYKWEFISGLKTKTSQSLNLQVPRKHYTHGEDSMDACVCVCVWEIQPDHMLSRKLKEWVLWRPWCCFSLLQQHILQFFRKQDKKLNLTLVRFHVHKLKLHCSVATPPRSNLFTWISHAAVRSVRAGYWTTPTQKKAPEKG